jgi:cob(I)alamin adenosyltransferase
MTRFFTRNGDSGETSLARGSKVRKDDLLVEAIGNVDELNSAIGLSRFYVRDETLRSELQKIQNDLFSIGAMLASLLGESTVKMDKSRVERLESAIENMSSKLPELNKFVLPGGSEEASHLHLARSVARRAERKVVAVSAKHKIDENVLRYMNRVSSFLFTAALYVNHINGVEESHPVY